jgi:heme-degrading monooxygenase HmoA
VMEHIKGALCIPHYDLGYHRQFLAGKDIRLYCNTERRSAIAHDRLAKMDIDSRVLSLKEQEAYEWEEGAIVSAMNFVSIRSGHEEKFLEMASMLCRATEHMDGFLGSKVFRASGMSGIGSSVPGDLTDVEAHPTRMILLTYWASKQAHEASHRDPDFKAVFDALAEQLTEMPREEFYEVLK